MGQGRRTNIVISCFNAASAAIGEVVQPVIRLYEDRQYLVYVELIGRRWWWRCDQFCVLLFQSHVECRQPKVVSNRTDDRQR